MSTYLSNSCYGGLPPLPSSRKSSFISNVRQSSIDRKYDTPRRKYSDVTPARNDQLTGSDVPKSTHVTKFNAPIFPTSRKNSSFSSLDGLLSKRRGSLAVTSKEREYVESRFSVVSAPSVVTKRNFGLLRDHSSSSVQDCLQSVKRSDSVEGTQSTAQNSDGSHFKDQNRRGSAADALSQSTSPTTNNDPIKNHPLQKSRSVAFGEGGLGDRSCMKWSWPLPVQPKITNEEKLFEVEFDVYPYSTKDVWARIVGSELVLQLSRDDDGETRNHRFLKPLFRTYQLPLNIDPGTVKFRFKKDSIFIITAAKVPTLTLAVACFVDMAAAYTAEKRENVSESHSHVADARVKEAIEICCEAAYKKRGQVRCKPFTCLVSDYASIVTTISQTDVEALFWANAVQNTSADILLRQNKTIKGFDAQYSVVETDSVSAEFCRLPENTENETTLAEAPYDFAAEYIEYAVEGICGVSTVDVDSTEFANPSQNLQFETTVSLTTNDSAEKFLEEMASPTALTTSCESGISTGSSTPTVKSDECFWDAKSETEDITQNTVPKIDNLSNLWAAAYCELDDLKTLDSIDEMGDELDNSDIEDVSSCATDEAYCGGAHSISDTLDDS